MSEAEEAAAKIIYDANVAAKKVLDDAIVVASSLTMRAEAAEKTIIAHASGVDRNTMARSNAAIVLCITAFVIGVIVNVLMYTGVQHDNVLKHAWITDLKRLNPEIQLPVTPPEWGGADE